MIKNSILIIALLFSTQLYSQIKISKIKIIDKDGIGAMDMIMVDRTNSQGNYFDYIIHKDGFTSIDTIVANDFKIIQGIENDTLRIYDKTFILGDFFQFSEDNLKINHDSTSFNLTNKHRVTKHRKGLSLSKNEANIDIGIAVPTGFKITNVKAIPNSIKIFREKNIITFSGKEIKKLIYEIQYKKVNIETNYSSNGKKEIYRKRIPIEKKYYQIEIWDDEKEDGDIINVYFNKKLVIHDYTVNKEPITLPLDLSNAKKEKLILHFESVSEGTIKPNTVFFRIFGNGIDETIDLTTNSKINSIIEFTIKH